MCCPSPFWTRKMMRRRYGLENNDTGDCMMFCLCLPCSVCQDARELKVRGDYAAL